MTADESIGDHLGVRVGGSEQVVSGLAEVQRAWPDLVSHAARNTTLRPGDVLAVSLPAGEAPPLAPGDVVELEATGIGVLRNGIA